jgi:hypothetical protein
LIFEYNWKSIRMKYLIILLFGLLYEISFSQDCDNLYVNNDYEIRICNNAKWKIYSKGMGIFLEKNNLKFNFQYKYFGDSINVNIKNVWDSIQRNEYKEKSYFNIFDKKHLNIDSVTGYYGVVYLQEKSGKGLYQKKHYNFLFAFFHGNALITLNHYCYDSNYYASKKMFLEIIKRTSLFNWKNSQLSKSDSIKIESFYNAFYEGLKYSNKRTLKKMVITPPKMRQALRANMQDKKKRKRYLTFITIGGLFIRKEYTKATKEAIDKLFVEGEGMGIVWNQIEFVDFKFLYEPDMPDMKAIRGSFIFKYDSKLYSIRMRSIHIYKECYIEETSFELYNFE